MQDPQYKDPASFFKIPEWFEAMAGLVYNEFRKNFVCHALTDNLSEEFYGK